MWKLHWIDHDCDAEENQNYDNRIQALFASTRQLSDGPGDTLVRRLLDGPEFYRRRLPQIRVRQCKKLLGGQVSGVLDALQDFEGLVDESVNVARSTSDLQPGRIAATGCRAWRPSCAGGHANCSSYPRVAAGFFGLPDARVPARGRRDGRRRDHDAPGRRAAERGADGCHLRLQSSSAWRRC
jgi:hypothetical protein